MMMVVVDGVMYNHGMESLINVCTFNYLFVY